MKGAGQAFVASLPDHLAWWQHQKGFLVSTSSSGLTYCFDGRDGWQEPAYLQPVIEKMKYRYEN